MQEEDFVSQEPETPSNKSEMGSGSGMRKPKLLKVHYTAVRDYILKHPEETNWSITHSLKSSVPGVTQKIVTRQRDAINRGEYDSNNVRTVGVSPAKRKRIEEEEESFVTVPFTTVDGHVLQVQIPHSALKQVVLELLRDLL